MKLEFLLEIGCEEIPSSFLHPMSLSLKQGITDLISENSISLESSQHYFSPRRLIIHLTGVEEKQATRREIITGPPYKVAFDEKGNPSQATKGFARKNNIPIGDLSNINIDKGSYIGFKKEVVGQKTKLILLEKLPEVISRLELPKGMTWDSSGFIFVRPIRWILCLLGGEVLPIKVAGLKASCYTFGHRILRQNIKKTVNNFSNYDKWLRSNLVQINPEIRKESLEKQLNSKAEGLNAHLVEDPDLLGTVMNLMENPLVICGNFDKSFLNLPSEILITVMRIHQKYFSVTNNDGVLLPKFLAVIDSNEKYSDQIRIGHERVLKARLSDATFFWSTDLKITLESRVKLLKKIVFQENLGTMFNKSKRIKRLSKYLLNEFTQSVDVKTVEKAAELCKTDLTTDTVKEFSGLQGLMGGLCARTQGLEPAVVSGIYDHYLPTFFGDKVPRDLTGSILSIADKIDNVTSAFCLGLVPTGSRDPLALRRQTLGIIQILLEKKLDCSLENLLCKAFNCIGSSEVQSLSTVRSNFSGFLRERLRFVFKNQGFNYDEINSVVSIFIDNPVECYRRLNSLRNLRGSSDLNALAISFKRIQNILAKSGKEKLKHLLVEPSLLLVNEEKDLYLRINKVNQEFKDALGTANHGEAVRVLASLRPTVDCFFDNVFVMDKNRAVQRNRLALLSLLLNTFLGFADISKLVVN